MGGAPTGNIQIADIAGEANTRTAAVRGLFETLKSVFRMAKK